jgi:sulfur carrier protein
VKNAFRERNIVISSEARNLLLSFSSARAADERRLFVAPASSRQIFATQSATEICHSEESAEADDEESLFSSTIEKERFFGANSAPQNDTRMSLSLKLQESKLGTDAQIASELTDRMQIIVNGDPREVPDGLTVAALLDVLQMRANRVAIERNREILSRAQWQATHVQPNDSFEIVQFVGGGSDQQDSTA